MNFILQSYTMKKYFYFHKIFYNLYIPNHKFIPGEGQLELIYYQNNSISKILLDSTKKLSSEKK